MIMFLTGKDITLRRESLGLNLKQFGEMLGVSEACVSRWEAGKRRPKYEMMERLNSIKVESNEPQPAAS